MAFQRSRIIECRAALCVRIEARAQRPQEEAEIGAFAVLALQQPRGSLHELARRRPASGRDTQAPLHQPPPASLIFAAFLRHQGLPLVNRSDDAVQNRYLVGAGVDPTMLKTCPEFLSKSPTARPPLI